MATPQTWDATYKTLIDRGLSRVEAAVLFGNLIVEQSGRGRRFAFRTPLDREETDCAPVFERSFVHQDWQDGESVVQAGETTGEEGFNLRFHRIEEDLDALAADTARLFLCLRELRMAVHDRMTELRDEVNALHAEIDGLRDDGGGRTLVVPDLGRDIVYRGRTRIFDEVVDLYEREGVVFPIPQVAPIAIDPTKDPRILTAEAVGGFVLWDEVNDLFAAGPVTPEELVTRFGDRVLSSGLPVRDELTILPPGGEYATPDALVADLVERHAGAIRSSGVDVTAIGDALGIAAGGAVEEAPVTGLAIIPQQARAVLAELGAGTVGELVAQDPTELAAKLADVGVAVTPEEIGGWKGVGQIMIGIG